MSPLAKGHRSRPGLCERFEGFIATREVCNAYTELNDPFVQKDNFEEQTRQKDAGDDEAQGYDETFVSSRVWGRGGAQTDGGALRRLMRALFGGFEIATRRRLTTVCSQARARSSPDWRVGTRYRPVRYRVPFLPVVSLMPVPSSASSCS